MFSFAVSFEICPALLYSVIIQTQEGLHFTADLNNVRGSVHRTALHDKALENAVSDGRQRRPAANSRNALGYRL